MIVILAEAKIAEKDLEKARTAGKIMAEKSSAEQGCNLYAFSEDLNEPGLIRITEEWDSEDDLKRHFTEPHMADFQKTLGEIEVISMKAEKYTVSGKGKVM
ncbi:MAG: putative quinol monooxygenase [Alphaproteobacteria bacterium]|nr:putative quinol monooxygenase [Alphaproteobacteria bacterium]